MSTNESAKTANPQSQPSQQAIIRLLASAIVLAFACNIYQYVRQQKLEHDIDVGRQSAERQIQDMKQNVSGALQQHLLQEEELNQQLQALKAAAAEPGNSTEKRNRPPLAKRVVRGRQEAPDLSDLRSDLKQDAAFKAQISSDLQKTDSALQRVASELDARNESVATNSKDVEVPTLAAAQDVRPEPEPLAAAPKKKGFWRKLNPFHWKKHSSGSDPVQ